MITFKDAAMAKTCLKMHLSNFAWFKTICVEYLNDEIVIVVNVSDLGASAKSNLPSHYKGVAVKAYADNHNRSH
jgi:hypothetical protein